MVVLYKWQFSSVATAATESEAAPVVSAVAASVVVIYKRHMLTSLMHQAKNIILFLLNTFNSFCQTSSSSLAVLSQLIKQFHQWKLHYAPPCFRYPHIQSKTAPFLSKGSSPYRDAPFHISPALITPLIPTKMRCLLYPTMLLILLLLSSILSQPLSLP